jgi:hypothetical protein
VRRIIRAIMRAPAFVTRQRRTNHQQSCKMQVCRLMRPPRTRTRYSRPESLQHLDRFRIPFRVRTMRGALSRYSAMG